MYKYFKDSEVIGLIPDFVKKLDIARSYAGVPFVITSGYRTPEHNRAVGGVEKSQHTKGIAVDIACNIKDTQTVNKIIWGLGKANIAFIEVCNKHIHADDRPSTKPLQIFFNLKDD